MEENKPRIQKINISTNGNLKNASNIIKFIPINFCWMLLFIQSIEIISEVKHQN
jgi:hypothetical protein